MVIDKQLLEDLAARGEDMEHHRFTEHLFPAFQGAVRVSSGVSLPSGLPSVPTPENIHPGYSQAIRAIKAIKPGNTQAKHMNQEE